MDFDSNWEELCLSANSPIRQAIGVLETSDSKICLVVENISESGKKLIGTITDGDVRRSILEVNGIDSICGSIMNTEPQTASASLDSAELQATLKRYQIKQLPLLNQEGIFAVCIVRVN